MATTILETVTTIPAGTLRLLLTSICYRAKARKEMRREPPVVPHRPPRPATGLPRRVKGASRRALTADTVPNRKPPGMGSIETPPGLHGLRYAAPSYMPYYNRASVLTCAASGRDGGIWYALEALRRCDVLQRGASLQYSRIHRHTTAAKYGE